MNFSIKPPFYRPVRKTPREYFHMLLSQTSSILEIGPLTKPFVMGNNVKFFDVHDSDCLIEIARQLNFPVESAPSEIHYVSPTSDLGIVKEKFEAVFSSHCLEHQIDIIKHINDVFSLLKDNGAYYMFVPDARYCFDHFRPLSTVAEIIQAYFFKHENHSLKSFVEMNTLITHNDSRRHWAQDHGQPQITLNKLKHWIDTYLAQYKKKYLDTHEFCFTDEKFLYIIKSLYYLGYIDCLPSYFTPTLPKSNEFSCILQKPVPHETSVVYNLSEHMERSIIYENCTLENGIFRPQPDCEPIFRVLSPFVKNSSALELNLGLNPKMETALKIYYSADRFSFSDNQSFSFPLRKGRQTGKINIPLETLPDLFYIYLVPVAGPINFTLLSP